MKLDFVIIGGQKCGSTYVQNTISCHPEVAMIEKECPHFENPDYENNGMELLQKKLSALDQSKLVGIKRPNYLAKPEVPERLLKVNPDLKLIVILRNPLERFKSAYFHQMNFGVGPVLPLNEGAAKLMDGSLVSKYPRTKEILEFGLYGKYIEQYLDLFGKNILVLTFDELKKDNLELLKQCYTFLGIENTFIPHEVLETRPMKVNYSLNSVKLLRQRNRFRFRYNSNKTRLELKKQNLIDKIGNKLIEKLNDLIFVRVAKKPQKPTFNKEIKKELISWYAQDIELLEKLTNKDLSLWKV